MNLIITPKRLFTLIAIAFLVSVNSVYSQKNIYSPENVDSLFSYLDKTTDYQISKFNKKFLSKKKKILTKRLKILKEQLKDSAYIFVPEIDNQLNRILNVIYQANPELKQYHFHFFIDKTIIPNAAAFGDGNFVINLGLFNFVDSDDELAFIICHEIAHFIKNDVNSAIEKYVETINSRETRTKIREIKQQRFGQTNAGMKLLKELSFDMFAYSRDKEISADMIGFQLYEKTPYTKNYALIGLNKLGKLEDIVLSDSICIRSFFSFNNYHFNTSLIKKRQRLFDSDKKINDYKFDKDSLRSHPHTKERINALLSNYQIDTLTTTKTDTIISLLKNSTYKTLIKSLFDSKQFDLLLYYSIRNIENNIATENDYTNIARALQLIHQYKKRHLIGKYIARTSPFSEEKYLNRIRLFIHNSELSDIKNIYQGFTEEYRDKIDTQILKQINNYFKL